MLYANARAGAVSGAGLQTHGARGRIVVPLAICLGLHGAKPRCPKRAIGALFKEVPTTAWA